MRDVCLLINLLCFLAGAPFLHAQGTRADYDRAEKLARDVRGTVPNLNLKLHWFADNTAAWFRAELGDGEHEFRVVRTLTSKVEAAFDHPRLAASLGKVVKRELDPRRLALEELKFSDDLSSFDFLHDKKRWSCNRLTYEITRGLTEVTVAPKDAPQTKTLKEISPSNRTGVETFVFVKNDMTETVELLWSDPQGKLKSYGKLKHGEEHRQHTFAGHVWVFKDSNGKVLQIIEAADQEANIVFRSSKEEQNPATEEDGSAQQESPRDEPRRQRERRVIVRNDNVFFA